MAKIYLASSWKNGPIINGVANKLRSVGHEVYDFTNPPGRTGFSWDEIDTRWKDWDLEDYKKAINNPIAEAGFKSDFDAMKWADTCILILPCGRSAHTEAGWFAGQGKKVIVLYTGYEPITPELMYKIYDYQTDFFPDIIRYLGEKTE